MPGPHPLSPGQRQHFFPCWTPQRVRLRLPGASRKLSPDVLILTLSRRYCNQWEELTGHLSLKLFLSKSIPRGSQKQLVLSNIKGTALLPFLYALDFCWRTEMHSLSCDVLTNSQQQASSCPRAMGSPTARAALRQSRASAPRCLRHGTAPSFQHPSRLQPPW